MDLHLLGTERRDMGRRDWYGKPLFAATGLLMLVTGCASWHTYDSARTLHSGQSLPYQVRATRPDSSRIELTAPFVRSDSLYGRVRGDTVGMALSDIANLERSRISPLRSAALVVGVPVVAFGLAYFVLCEMSCEEGSAQ
jgi:hypothetical protein